MKRALATLLYFFRWQRIMAWTTGIGLALMIVGELLPPPFRFFPVLFGSVLAFAFPVAFAGIAFRELISNRRFLMVPAFRTFCAVGLLLLALIATGAALMIRHEASPDIPIADPARVALFSFSIISAYMLLSQWLVIYALGLIGFVVLPLIGLRLFNSDSLVKTFALDAPWLLAAIAVLGWVWLIIAMRRGSVPKPVAPPVWGQNTAPDSGSESGQILWLPQWGRPASAVGTFLRGMPDGNANRVASLLMATLAFPVAIWLVLFLIGAPPPGNSQQQGFGIGFFLLWSVFGVTMQSSAVNREWPARLRYLWLRAGIDRRAGWQLIERSLLSDMLIIAIIAASIALLFALFSSFEAMYLGLYVVGCVMITAMTTYVGFWTRAANWNELVQGLLMISIILLFFVSLGFFRNRDAPEALFWLIPILGLLTVLFRTLAKRRMARIDWCAVRPTRLTRKHV